MDVVSVHFDGLRSAVAYHQLLATPQAFEAGADEFGSVDGMAGTAEVTKHLGTGLLLDFTDEGFARGFQMSGELCSAPPESR